jgi:hypothetical protein
LGKVSTSGRIQADTDLMFVLGGDAEVSAVGDLDIVTCRAVELKSAHIFGSCSLQVNISWFLDRSWGFGRGRAIFVGICSILLNAPRRNLR